MRRGPPGNVLGGESIPWGTLLGRTRFEILRPRVSHVVLRGAVLILESEFSTSVSAAYGGIHKNHACDGVLHLN